MNQKYDVIVIGGGHNGLVNVAYLARSIRELHRRAFELTSSIDIGQ
jgi:tRNA U34 5-carboxymethylaminomethyl modifying enzyme MnmG/GidA